MKGIADRSGKRIIFLYQNEFQKGRGIIMRKFISVLSAAALASSMLVPLSVSAADAVYSYDGSDVSSWTTGDSHLFITSETDSMGAYAKITTDGSSTYSTSMELPTGAQLTDNYVIEYDVMIHQSNGMGRYNRYNQVAFIASDAEKTDTRDFGAYAAVLGEGTANNTETGNGYISGVASSVTSIYGMTSAVINDRGIALEPSTDASGIVSDKWYRVQTAVSGTAATVTVIDNERNKIVDKAEYVNSASALSKIFVTVGRGDKVLEDGSRVNDGGIVALDNIKIYGGTAEALTTDGLRGEIAPTEEPTDAPTPEPAAPITKTTEYTFDGDDQITPAVGNGTTATVVEGTNDGNTTKVMEVAQTSGKDNACGYAMFDISSLTAGKSHIIVDYDLHIDSDGRMNMYVSDLTSGITSTKNITPSNIFVHGLGGSSASNAVLDEWFHTSVDIDLEHGAYSYAVTKQDGTSVAKGDGTTDKTAVNTLQMVSWAANTSYIDNIKVQTGGEYTAATQEPEPAATAEPAATVEGSDLTLLPEGATQFGTFESMEGTATAVVNHTSAKPAVNEGTGTVYNADANIRGNSVYMAYDVLVNGGDVLNIHALGNDTSKLGPQFVITGNADGTATASYIASSSGAVKLDGNLVCGTWYRVLVELPQDNNGGNTNTGKATYTIYRIDKTDTSKVTEIAAQATDISPRNLSDRAAVNLKAVVTGTPYIDNGVTFMAANGFSYIENTSEPETATPEPAGTAEGSNINLAEGKREAIKTFTEAGVEGTATKVVNHTSAKPAVAGSVSAYHEDAKGNAVYAAYDVYVEAGDSITLTAMNDTSVGTAYKIVGNADGTAAAYYDVSKGDVKVSGNLVCGTWYRVVIEIPQSASGTGSSIYTIYRINGTDCTKTAGIAAQAMNIGARNLSSRAVKTLDVTVEGSPYIDNGVTYIDGDSVNTWYRYGYTKDENGVLTNVTIEKVDPTKNGPQKGYYVWNTYMKPYVAPAVDETPAE